MRGIDLHTHSDCSDGTYTVKELIDYAHQKNLAAIALTDHDTVKGLDEAITYAEEKYQDMEVIPGVEVSTVNEGKDCHIVGLYIDHHDEAFIKRLEELHDIRIKRNIEICDRLRTIAGFSFTYDDVVREYPGAVITRAHFARYLHEKGFVGSRQEAFDRFIGDGKPCFVPPHRIGPETGVKYILDAGGIPILAHPILYHLSDAKLDALVSRLKDAGLMGIEAIYSTYEARDERQIKELAAKYDLLISGGSDFHGKNKPKIDLGSGFGRLFIPEDVLTAIKASRLTD